MLSLMSIRFRSLIARLLRGYSPFPYRGIQYGFIFALSVPIYHGFFGPKRDASNTTFSQIPDKYVPALEKIYLEQKPFYEKLKMMKRA